ncbi:MAG: hypothetical protein Q9159_003470 [Coniocarpon cinnabarinum]
MDCYSEEQSKLLPTTKTLDDCIRNGAHGMEPTHQEGYIVANITSVYDSGGNSSDDSDNNSNDTATSIQRHGNND